MKLLPPKWATATLFLLDGTGFGVWAAHVPVIQRNLRLDTAALSLVLLCIVSASILSMPLTGYLIARFGSRTVVRVVAASYAASVFVLSLLHTHWTLMAGAALFGAVKGALDVAVNAQALAVEQRTGRSCMNLCQGCWSLGGLLGAGASSLLLKHGGSAQQDLLLCALLLAALCLAAFPSLLRETPTPKAHRNFTWPDSQILRLALLAFFGLFAEGAVGDWAAVYLHSNLGASLAWAAAGFAVYAITMASARFAGGWIVQRISEPRLLVASGLLMASGFAILIAAPIWPIGFLGLALTGIGVANVVPVIMNAAGRNPRMASGPAISAVSTIGYFGFLAGPPLIGWIAHYIGLQLSLLLVVCAGLVVAAGPRFNVLTNATATPGPIADLQVCGDRT